MIRFRLKSALVLLLLVSLTFATYAGGGQQSGAAGTPAAPQVIRIANFYAASHPVNVALRDVFKPQIEARTNGRFEIQIFDNNQLGAERELTEGVRLGTIEMGIAGGLLAGTYPKLMTLELPFMFDDFAHVWRVLDGPLGEEFAAEFAKANIKVLSWLGNGFRVFSNSVRPIRVPADAAGIRMRMPENPIYIGTAQDLGFNVQALPFGEVFNALSTKVVDGQDNPLATLVASRFYEVQDYVTISNHMFSHASIVINMDLWNRMSPADQAIFQAVATETAAVQRRLLEEATDGLIAQVQAAGLTVTMPDTAAFRRATEPTRNTFAAQHAWAPALIRAILDQAN